MNFRLPIPQNWQDFESICQKLWSEIWNDPTCQKNGRQGQAQHGVDVFGMPIYTKRYAGVQCKDKDETLGSKLEENELKKECDKATKFVPNISSFTLATTSPRDASIQKVAREINENREFPFFVQVWSWDDIQSEIVYRPSILEHFYSQIPSQVGANALKLTRYSPTDRFYAYFERPIIKQTLPSDLKDFLISLSYELSDNAYKYGKATFFSVEIEPRRIIIKDDGNEFDILSNFDNTSTTSLSGNIGSYVLSAFIKKFDGMVTAKYTRKSEDEIEVNQLELTIADNFEELDKKDYIELTVDWRHAAGRDSARKIAYSFPIGDEIKEIIWTVVDGYAMSFSAEFILALLGRLNKSQKLIVSIPRRELFENFKSWIDDDRLIIQRR